MTRLGAAFALWLSLASGCDAPIQRPPAPPLDHGDDGKQEPGLIDLGVALHPEDLDPGLATPRDWSVPPDHRFGYALGKTEADGIRDRYARYKRRMRVRATSRGFTHHPPSHCRDGLRCVYNDLIRSNQAAVLPIAQRFLDFGRSRGMTTPQLVRVIVTWVQNISYRVPDEDPYGINPPALVAEEHWGDCDSKSLLAIMLLRMVGVNAVILESRAAEHSLVGVHLPVAGDRVELRGQSWAVVEVTQPNWPLGRMPPPYRNVRDWRLIRLRILPSASEPKADEDT